MDRIAHFGFQELFTFSIFLRYWLAFYLQLCGFPAVFTRLLFESPRYSVCLRSLFGPQTFGHVISAVSAPLVSAGPGLIFGWVGWCLIRNLLAQACRTIFGNSALFGQDNRLEVHLHEGSQPHHRKLQLHLQLQCRPCTLMDKQECFVFFFWETNGADRLHNPKAKFARNAKKPRRQHFNWQRSRKEKLPHSLHVARLTFIVGCCLLKRPSMQPATSNWKLATATGNWQLTTCNLPLATWPVNENGLDSSAEPNWLRLLQAPQQTWPAIATFFLLAKENGYLGLPRFQGSRKSIRDSETAKLIRQKCQKKSKTHLKSDTFIAVTLV